MVNVLWGVAAIKLEHQCTAADVLAKFNEVMQLDNCSGNGKQRVDVYRLVPITDPSSEVAEEEKLVVHLPCSEFDCKAIEETYQQLRDAEIRNERCQESLLALAEALRASEGFSDARAPEAEDMQRLRQENSTLRQQLELCEHARRVSEQKAQSQEECSSALHRELGFVRHEVVIRRNPAWQVGSATAPQAACPMSTAPAVLIPNSCIHGGSQPGSAPVTPRVPQLRQLAPRIHVSAMSAAVPSGAPSGLSMARMAQSAFTVPAMVERMREPCNLAGSAEAPQQVGVVPPGRCTATGKVTKVSALRTAGQR
mmetsp:Transcript_107173/g.130770  ORF Transcript_107173/g.130770 Transcript_107173/m.130770 type:complete len:311 (-) Transcript_107173:12-944(-)